MSTNIIRFPDAQAQTWLVDPVTVHVVRKRPLHGAGSIWDTSGAKNADNAQWNPEPEEEQGTPAIRVMDALLAMGDGELTLGWHRFTAIACQPFEKPEGVIVRDLNGHVPARTWLFVDFVALDGTLFEGYEELPPADRDDRAACA